jgi:hypothetical protein
VCYDRGLGIFAYLTHTDDSSSTVACYKLDDVTKVAKLGYYAAKLLQLLKTTPPPP